MSSNGKSRLTEIGTTGSHKFRVYRCACGVEKTIREDHVRTGRTKSCGCLQKEPKPRTHGKSRTPEHNIWNRIIDRCTNPRATSYPRYGGRGVTICDEWRHSFEAFFAEVGLRPSPTHSIDRIDNSRGYEPGNVRWATSKEQARNMRTNRVLEVDGVSMVVRDWASRTGISPTTILNRLNRGWDAKRAVTEVPVCTRPRRVGPTSWVQQSDGSWERADRVVANTNEGDHADGEILRGE